MNSNSSTENAPGAVQRGACDAEGTADAPRVTGPVAIIGLGLIGGSLARDLTALGVPVLAHDADGGRVERAIREHPALTAIDDSLAAVRAARVVIIAVPVDAAVEVLERLAPLVPDARLITDVGSTKARIVAAASRLGIGDRFVGGHPLAGDHRSGWEASRRGLFADAPVYLCPTAESSSDAVALGEELWRALGAVPKRMPGEEHDLMVALSSHLPQAISTALALSLNRQGVARSSLGPGGRDVTRLAGGSPRMWSAIALENAEALAAALARTEQEIARFRAALERRDGADVHARLARAKAWFDGAATAAGA